LKKKKKITKSKKITKKRLLTQKLERKESEIEKNFTKIFLKKIGSGKLKTKDYDDMRKLGLNPDEIRIKLDQIMEWNDNQTVAKD